MKRLLLLMTVFAICETESLAMKRCIISNDYPIESQFVYDECRYIIKDAINLCGCTIEMPGNSVLCFKNGSMNNGLIIGNDTEIEGDARLYCDLSGTFTNQSFPVSWLDDADPSSTAKRLEGVLNLSEHSAIVLDKNVALDESVLHVSHISISGKKAITRPCSFVTKGDVNLEDVSFLGFTRTTESFISFDLSSENCDITVEGVRFDGGHEVSRFINRPYVPGSSESTVNLRGNIFSGLSKYVVNYQCLCSGNVIGNHVVKLGSSSLSNVVAFQLGYHDEDMNANSFMITDNVIEEILVPYSKVDDSREAHAFLIYGHQNTVSRNKISRIFSEGNGSDDPGLDAEGIYIKGGGNLIEQNFLDNCVGTTPDGAITVKSGHEDNIIRDNTIRHKYGNAILCYSPASIIHGNIIETGGNARGVIFLYVNHGTVIEENKISVVGIADKSLKAVFLIMNSNDISVVRNTINGASSLLATYDCDGELLFSQNSFSIFDQIYGVNTYYNAPFELFSGSCNYVFASNSLSLTGSRGSQIFEVGPGFSGKITALENTFSFADSASNPSQFSYMFRNPKELVEERNKIISSKTGMIGKISNK